jgi:hypothetical protein
MIALPTIFEMNLVAVRQSPHTQILEKAEWSTRRHADEPKCNGQFLTVVTQMKPLLFLLYIMLNKFGYPAHTQLCSSVQTVFQVCMDFYHLRMFLVIYYKYMHNIIHLNSGVTWLLLHTPFQPLSLNV